MSVEPPAASGRMPEELAFRRLAEAPALLVSAATFAAIALVLNHLLNLKFFAGITVMENQYLFLLAVGSSRSPSCATGPPQSLRTSDPMVRLAARTRRRGADR